MVVAVSRVEEAVLLTTGVFDCDIQQRSCVAKPAQHVLLRLQSADKRHQPHQRERAAHSQNQYANKGRKDRSPSLTG
eukprot:1996059-Rhodomonas_salina.1